MNFKKIFLVLLVALTVLPANSRLNLDGYDNVLIEGQRIEIRGKKGTLTSRSNPAQLFIENLDGTNRVSLNTTVNKKRGVVQATLNIDVDKDVKLRLVSQGGNVPADNPQSKPVAVLDEPGRVIVASETVTFNASDDSGIGSVPGPQGDQGVPGPQGTPGFVYGGERNLDPLPDYSERYMTKPTLNKAVKTMIFEEGMTLTAGEVVLGLANAITLVDSNKLTRDIVGLIKGTGEVGQHVTMIVNDFFFLGLQNRFCQLCRDRAPILNSITAPNFAVGLDVMPAGRTIEVSRYQLMPVFPGQVLEFVFDGTQWRMTSLPFIFLDIDE